MWYYPNIRGNFTDPSGTTFGLAYNIFKYEIGGTFTFSPTLPLYIEFGFLGDKGTGRSNAPSDFSHSGPFVGLGLKF